MNGSRAVAVLPAWNSRFVMIVGAAAMVHAQEAPAPPAITLARYEGDYSYLRDPKARSGFWWEPFKFIPLEPTGTAFLSTGAEIRYRFESIRNPDFNFDGAVPRNTYVLQRLLLYADLHLGPHVRFFGQLGSYAVLGETTPLNPTQDDPSEIAQAFADLKLPLGEDAGDLTLRGGRQEMSFGSLRLVSGRNGTNVRFGYDGAHAIWQSGGVAEGWRIDAFLTRPVENRDGTFDDRSDPRQIFGGLYAAGPLAPALLPGIKLDVYYFGLSREDASFAQGIADEKRHTIGARLSRKGAGFDWDVEATYQFGSFGTDAKVRAWATAADLGYTFAKLPWSPRLGVGGNITSGDEDPQDRTLGTYNPLFADLTAFSEAALVWPANLINVAPNVTITPMKDLTVSVTWDSQWKQQVEDAFYVPPYSPVEGTAGGSRFLGQSVQILAEWKVTREIELSAAYVHFFAEGALRHAGGKDVDFTMLSASLKF